MSRLATSVVAVCLSILSSARADTPTRPTVAVIPADQRIPQLSKDARAAIEEIDGEARGWRLLDLFSAAEKRGDLRRWALEIQSVVHPKNGDYLFKLYLVIRDDASKSRAIDFAKILANMGVAVSPSSGHFQSLEHMDPDEPPPDQAPGEVRDVPLSRWVDSFVEARYDLGYRPNRKGSLSEMLQLEYKDGVVVDIDIRVISDNREPATFQANMRAYVGPGDRLYPLRLNRDTTPRLWRAKHDVALAKMGQSNQEFADFASIGLSGILANLPVTTVAPAASVQGPRPAARQTAATRPALPRGSVIAAARTRQAAQTGEAAVASESAAAAAEVRVAWPPKPPSGPKPALDQPGAATWRYERYVHDAYKAGKGKADVLPYRTWKKRHFDTAARGGRPGRPGSVAHKDDVKRNNIPNRLEPKPVGNRIPDGVGEYGQTVTIRRVVIKPVGKKGRVIVESDHTIRNGTIPDSAARAQIRDIRKADPEATIVLTDFNNPEVPPLIYPPGTQPPPKGPLPADQAPIVSYPDP